MKRGSVTKREELQNEKASLLQEFLASTQRLNGYLEEEESPEQLSEIQKEIEERDRLIEKVTAVNSALTETKATGDEKKHQWLEQQLLTKIQELEERNEGKIAGLMQNFMEKARSAKDSMRVIDAYAKQTTGEEVRGNIDKKR
ncbi:MAG TPA: hypothetical protein DEB31_10155 [Clostridiales bacterium]|nr:hypothetical protein [Clostridiales bacterium]